MLSEYKNKLLISIITVVKNNEKTIESSIKSVLNQTYSNIEYIIIDGASTDGTVDILNKYDEKITYWCSESDKGIYDAMNKALSISTGDYVYFLGSDDVLSKTDTITSVANFIAQNQSNHQKSMFYGDVFNKSLNRLKKQPNSTLTFAYLNICQQSIFYNREMLLRQGSFDIRYTISADHAVNLKLWNLGSLYMPIEICKYAGDGVSSFSYDQLFAKQRNLLILSSLGIFPFFFQLLIKPIHLIFKSLVPEKLYRFLLNVGFSR
jgi:glycosyltransferase involved in cell wall biosynthesis